MIGTSAALCVAGVPFDGPMGAARDLVIDGNYVLNPSYDELENSYLDIVVAGTDSAVLMVESEAKELSEDLMLGAVLFAHDEMQGLSSRKNGKDKAGKEDWVVAVDEETPVFYGELKEKHTAAIEAAFKIVNKSERTEAISVIKSTIIAEYEELDDMKMSKVMGAFKKLESDIVRTSIIQNKTRIDGRDQDTVRPIYVEVGVLPRTHGSALFTRGETQALVVATLGSTRDAQRIESIEGQDTDHFMLHYNFPAYTQ